MTAGGYLTWGMRTVPGYWWCGDPEVDPWEWREIIRYVDD